MEEGETGEKSSEQGENKQQQETKPRYDAEQESNQNGPHWWEAEQPHHSVTPILLPKHTNVFSSYLFIYQQVALDRRARISQLIPLFCRAEAFILSCSLRM